MNDADFAALPLEYGVRSFLTAEVAALLDQPARAVGRVLARRARDGEPIEVNGRRARLVKAGRAGGGWQRWRFEPVPIEAPAPAEAASRDPEPVDPNADLL